LPAARAIEISLRTWASRTNRATHVQNILNKLNVNSRAGVAAWAVEHGFHSVH